MRNHGSRFEILRMKPHDHIGWTFSGNRDFSALAEQFLREGASLNERLMYVAEDPDPTEFGRWTEELYPGTLIPASTAEVYGESGIIDAARQRATFAAVLADALAEGYSGIRVAADNTRLVIDLERLESWIRWEVVADQFMAENQVTGLCAFDRDQVDVGTLTDLASLHPLSQAGSPAPKFRLFTNDGVLWVTGEVTIGALEQAELALQALPPKTDVIVDLTAIDGISAGLLAAVDRLRRAGAAVTLLGTSGTFQEQ